MKFAVKKHEFILCKQRFANDSAHSTATHGILGCTARGSWGEEEVLEEKEVNKKRCLEQRHLRAGGHTAHTHLRRGSRTNLQVVNTTAPGSEVSRGEK